MNTQDKSRELLSKARQEDENRQESMINRAIEADEAANDTLKAKTREILTEKRHKPQQVRANMLERTEEELEDSRRQDI